jgi:hypothetical protein
LNLIWSFLTFLNIISLLKPYPPSPRTTTVSHGTCICKLSHLNSRLAWPPLLTFSLLSSHYLSPSIHRHWYQICHHQPRIPISCY